MPEKKINEETFNVLSEIHTFEDNEPDQFLPFENKEYEILSAGKKVYNGNIIEITETDMDEMVKNFVNDIVGTELAVDENHDPNHRAFAWFNTLRRQGNKLLATFKDFTEEGRKIIQQGIYKYFSVEFENGFEKIIDGEKRIFNNVLRGVALTNRPVDKAINPTFSENLYFNLSKNMETIKIFAESLLKKEIVSASEKETFKSMLATLSEEEQEELKEDTEAVEAKPEEEEKKEEEATETEETTEEEKTEEKEEEAKTEELSEKNELSEIRKELKEAKSQNSKLEAKIRFAEIKENAEKEIMLSEKNNIGLSKEDTERATKLFATLSNKDMEEVISLIKAVKSVDFSEYGVADTETKDKETTATKLAEEKIAKAKEAGKTITFGQAMKEVYSDNPELAPQD